MNDPLIIRKIASNNFFALIVFLLLVVGIGLLLGFFFRPDNFYAELAKPFFNPPDAIFAPVWTILYLMIAIAGWRIWCRARKSVAMMLWICQMMFNWLWTPIFFMAHNIMGALIIILVLLVTIVLFIIKALKYDRIAAWLFIPYAIWVSFATILNIAIALLN